VAGRWSFASGARHATWFTANCLLDDGETTRAVAVPATEIELVNTWSVLGLRGTGSHDFMIEDRFVPAARTFSTTDDPREAGPLYRFPFFSVAELSFGAVALGVARRALDEFAALARDKRPLGSPTLLRDDADARARYARAEATVRSSRA
jgi:alkylation response protein AidB-like acyl-CoA dehydrogenase